MFFCINSIFFPCLCDCYKGSDFMKKFISRHIILLSGTALLFIMPVQMAALGFAITLLYLMGIWIASLIINAVTFALSILNAHKNNVKLFAAVLLLSVFGGAIGTYTAKLLRYDTKFTENNIIKFIFDNALGFNIYVMAVLPLFWIITEKLFGPNYIGFRLFP